MIGAVTGFPLAFARRDDRRVLAGVAGGFADQHGVDAVVVRGALVLLTFAGGLGLVLYAVGAVASTLPVAPAAAGHPADQRRNLSVACITFGLLLVVRSTGLWFGDRAMVPLTAMVSGVVVLGVLRGDQVLGTHTWAEMMSGRWARVRLLAGAGLIATGLVLVGLGILAERARSAAAQAVRANLARRYRRVRRGWRDVAGDLGHR